MGTGADLQSMLASLQGDGTAPGPGIGNRADYEERGAGAWSWSEAGEEVQISLPLGEATQKKDVKVTFKLASLTVHVDGFPLLEGNLGGPVEVDECTWCLVNGGWELQVMLTKKTPKKWADLF